MHQPKEKLAVKELRVVESTPAAVSFVAVSEQGEMTLFISSGVDGLIRPGVSAADLAQWQKTGVYKHFADQIGPPNR